MTAYMNLFWTTRGRAFCGTHSQMESVAGAAHLPNDYPGALRCESSFGPKEEMLAFFDTFSTSTKHECSRDVVLWLTAQLDNHVDPSTREHREQLSDQLFINFLC